MSATVSSPVCSRQPSTAHSPAFRALVAGLDALATGSGSAAELRGDPGSGKTWLLSALADEAHRRGIRVLRGCATEYQSASPYHLVADAFANPLGDRSGAPATADPAALVRTLAYGPFNGPDTAAAPRTDQGCEFLRAVNGLLRDWSQDGLLLIMDNVHWADPDSLKVLDYLLRQRITIPLYLVVAQRPRQAAPRLRGTLAQGVEQRTVRRIELAPLTRRQSAALVGMEPDAPLLRRLHRESHGVPLYLNALARVAARAGLTEQSASAEPIPVKAVPEELAARLLSETGALAPDELLVLQACAVAGSPVDSRVVSHVAGLDDQRTCEIIDTLNARDLLRTTDEDAPGLVFRHPLLRRAIYDDLAPCSRIKAHRRAAGARATLGAPDHEVARDVERFAAQPLPEQAALLHRAAHQVLATDPVTATRWLRLALQGLPAGPERGQVLLTLATALASTGALAESDEILLELLDAERAAPAGLRSAAVELGARIRAALGHYVEARSVLASGTGADPLRASDGDGGEHVAVLLLQGFIDLLAGRPPAREEVDEALRLAPRTADPANLAGAYAMDALHAALTGDTARAGAAADRAAEAVDQLSTAGHPEYLAAVGWSELVLGRPASAERHLARGEAALRATGQGYLRPVFLLGLAFSRIGLARLDEARATAAAAEAAVAESGLECGLAKTVASVSGVLGALTDRHGGPAAPLVSQNGHWSTLARLWLAEAAQLAGDHQLGLNLLSPVATDPTLPQLPPPVRPRAHELLAGASAFRGRPAAVWALQAAAAAAAGPAHDRAFALAAEAHLARQNGASGRAAALYEEAADLLESTEVLWARAWTLANAATCLAESDGAWRAEPLRARAEAITGRAMVPEPVAVPRILGAPLPHRPGEEPAGRARSGAALSVLTDREREVATIAGAGLRSREVAERLHLSPRTVDVHLNRIYRKLNITSRSALVRLMAERS
ncbi:AAA family ATPase [Kitasatospora sp. NPDC056184]|uniref:helix-turn-helix transcriptional regulator n=1 Tax=Kitasatospora sp. NPDC056184 TaxID=3345738 RepID=UPI0035DB26F7